CLAPVLPAYSDPQITAPAPSRVLAHPPVYYLKGTQVDVTLTLPECTSITDVRWGSIPISTSSGGIDPPPAWYTPLSDIPLPDHKHRVTIRITAQLPWTNGDSLLVTLTIKSNIGYRGLVDYSFYLAGVQDIGSDQTLRLPQTQLDNQLIAAVYGRFG